MSDLFYSFIRFVGTSAFWTSSSPTILNLDRTVRDGPFIIASNHQSPYDVALLIRHVRRKLDFVSIVEVFKNPFVAWFYGSMNAFPVDRSKPDAPTVRIILDRLQRQRVVALFPEGRIRREEDSVIASGRIRPGAARLAQMANVPIVPCIIINSVAYAKFTSWLPLMRTRYGMIFGEAIDPAGDPKVIEQRLVDAFVALHAQLKAAMSGKG